MLVDVALRLIDGLVARDYLPRQVLISLGEGLNGKFLRVGNHRAEVK